MATLTNADFTEIRRRLYNDPIARATFRSWALAKADWKSLFQTAETWFTGGFSTRPATSLKAAFDAVTATTNAQAQQVAWLWVNWKYKHRND